MLNQVIYGNVINNRSTEMLFRMLYIDDINCI